MRRRPRYRQPLIMPNIGRIPLPVDPASTMFEWFGVHTVVAMVIGFALPPVIALAIGVFGGGQDADYSADAVLAAFPEVYREHYEQSAKSTRVRFFVEKVNGDPALTGSWAQGVRDGWQSGWYDAIDAMRAALATTELPEDAHEYQALDEIVMPGGG